MDALILMTRIPIAGTTKTRLLGSFSGEECALLHFAFLKDLMCVINSLAKVVDIYVYFTPSHQLHLIKEMLPCDIHTFSQEGNTLGDKMLFGFEKLFKKDYKKVILMGSDIPQIQEEDILGAYNILNNSDLVIGPTMDGGYYLIGMKKLHREIFTKKMNWGYTSVFDETVATAVSKNLSLGFIKKMLDIDTKEDLLQFQNQIDDFKKNLVSPPVETIKYIEHLTKGIL